jgi:RNA polymerase sigma factor (TIGR02999 family)
MNGRPTSFRQASQLERVLHPSKNGSQRSRRLRDSAMRSLTETSPSSQSKRISRRGSAILIVFPKGMQPENESPGQITNYLKRLANGDSSAEDPLAEIVYVELQRMARRILRGKSPDFSLQTDALVNDALLELVRLRSVDWQDRSHFFRVASRLLRRRLIDHIRGQRALKRPPPGARLSLEDILLPAPERFEEVLFVNEGLEQLAKFDTQLAELVELVYFGGVPIDTIAEIRGVSQRTIDRHLDLARRWMETRLRTLLPPLGPKAAPPGTT